MLVQCFAVWAFKCPACPLTFDCPWYLERHRFCQHSPSAPPGEPAVPADESRLRTGWFPCLVCSRRFKSYQRLVNHGENHARGSRCKFCGKGFFDDVAVKRHQKSGSVCTWCEPHKDFRCPVGLKKHCRQNHM